MKSSSQAFSAGLIPSAVVVVLVSCVAACAGTGPRTANQSAGGSPTTGGSSAASGTGGTGAAGGGAHAGGNDAGLIDAGDLAPDLSTRFPAAGATQVCIDAQLRLDFSAPVTLGTTG